MTTQLHARWYLGERLRSRFDRLAVLGQISVVISLLLRVSVCAMVTFGTATWLSEVGAHASAITTTLDLRGRERKEERERERERERRGVLETYY